MKRKKVKTIPLFSSEREEASFWERVDSSDYFSGKGDVRVKLPPRTTSISFRIPQRLLDRLKRLAEFKDVPYQSLLKIYLDEKVGEEIVRLKRGHGF